MEERLHGNHADTKLVAFDAVLEMTMSRNLGFMKAGGDVDGVLKQLQKDLDYRGIVSSLNPRLHRELHLRLANH